MKKSFSFTLAGVFCIFMFQAFTTSYQPRFKNLHILPKDINKDQIDSVMHHFTRSLGVKCSYCHVHNDETDKMDFASDAKPEKLIARKMMLMSIDINKNHFEQIEEELDSTQINPQDTVASSYMLKYVTCYTCHHGEAHPEMKPPPKKEDQKSNPNEPQKAKTD